MPKILSLKKTQQKGPLKNQQPITQFFKNTNATATRTGQDTSEKPLKLQEKHVGKQATNKRKAQSPVNLETIEICDDDSTSTIEPFQITKSNLHTPKKLKSCHDRNANCSKTETESIKKLSPLKENVVDGKHSPVESKKHCSTEILDERVNSKHNHEENKSTKKDRSPLTPLNIENLLGDSNSPTKTNNRYTEACLTNKGERKHTPRKTLTLNNHVKSSVKDNNHVYNVQGCVNNEAVSQPKNSSKPRTPKKSPAKVEVINFPPTSKMTPEKLNKTPSPSKSGSTARCLDFDQGQVVLDGFNDHWELGDIEEVCNEDLDLTVMQRCEVMSVMRHPSRVEARLRNGSGQSATCYFEGLWMDTPLSPGETISVVAGRDPNGSFTVGNTSGLVSLRPDHLMSSTSVVAGVFCKRKALLQERWRGIDSANTAMTIGILIHELVQKALTQKISDITQLHTETDKIIKESVQMLYDAGLTAEEARSNIQTYIPPLAEFMSVYVAGKPSGKQLKKDQWVGRVEKVLDIEENLCCPQLGLKGKIDATLEVTIHERRGRQRAVVPLELKSGKASVSAEHRGQLVLYGMMLSAQRNKDPATDVQRGLLLYLKDRVDVREVSCGYPERRDLLMLRNQLVQYLASGPEHVDPEQIRDIEDASCLLQQRLPEPIHHENACTKCPYLTICSLHLWHTDGPSVPESHPLSKLQGQALGHLSPEHIKYFLHWTALLKIEERHQMLATPLHALWTDGAEKRSKRGTCAANLRLKSVENSSDRYLHTFERTGQESTKSSKGSKAPKGPQEGEFSIVSLEDRPWIAAGVVTVANDEEIRLLLERDLSRRLSKDTVFHIDTYESYATTVQNLTNLGMILEDSDRALRLRNLIIDKQRPEFEKKLPREVGRLGTKLMKSLNIQQQRAVLKALSAKDYALLRGLPGTGKTQTISVLIQMLVGLKQRVLVTAHTHSAVDNVLSRLPDSIRIIRLGSSTRVAPSLQDRCEHKLAATCENPEQLGKLYDSMEVVGVTCLGAAHAMLARTTFDVCIMDEATQVVQSTALRPLLFARRFLLAGDPDQLPPVVRSRAARRLGMEESLFHRLLSEEATSTLQLQYRMNQPLADIANRVAYNCRLKCADQKVADAVLDIDLKKIPMSAAWLLTACDPEPALAAVFLDMAPTGGKVDSKSCSNSDEACAILAIIDALVQGGVKPVDIGVIAPYRDQVSLLRRAVARRGAECTTVDQFQGRDKSVILYSCTKKAVEDREVKEGEILNDQRRLAVSVTRAKHKLVVIGHSKALHRYKPLQCLIEACTTVIVDEDAVNNVVDKYSTEIV